MSGVALQKSGGGFSGVALWKSEVPAVLTLRKSGGGLRVVDLRMSGGGFSGVPLWKSGGGFSSVVLQKSGGGSSSVQGWRC